jgi:F-type H+/Na+-transporting ATPase subunit alpha
MEKIAEGNWDDSIESELGDAIAEAIDDFGPDFDEEGNPLEEGESDRIKSEDERAKPGRTAGEQDDSSSDRGQTPEGSDPSEREKEPASA